MGASVSIVISVVSVHRPVGSWCLIQRTNPIKPVIQQAMRTRTMKLSTEVQFVFNFLLAQPAGGRRSLWGQSQGHQGC